jgi:hypothetical protein
LWITRFYYLVNTLWTVSRKFRLSACIPRPPSSALSFSLALTFLPNEAFSLWKQPCPVVHFNTCLYCAIWLSLSFFFQYEEMFFFIYSLIIFSEFYHVLLNRIVQCSFLLFKTLVILFSSVILLFGTKMWLADVIVNYIALWSMLQ